MFLSASFLQLLKMSKLCSHICFKYGNICIFLFFDEIVGLVMVFVGIDLGNQYTYNWKQFMTSPSQTFDQVSIFLVWNWQLTLVVFSAKRNVISVDGHKLYVNEMFLQYMSVRIKYRLYGGIDSKIFLTDEKLLVVTTAGRSWTRSSKLNFETQVVFIKRIDFSIFGNNGFKQSFLSFTVVELFGNCLCV